MSFFLLTPVAIFMEGVKFTPAYVQAAVSNFLSDKAAESSLYF